MVTGETRLISMGRGLVNEWAANAYLPVRESRVLRDEAVVCVYGLALLRTSRYCEIHGGWDPAGVHGDYRAGHGRGRKWANCEPGSVSRVLEELQMYCIDSRGSASRVLL